MRYPDARAVPHRHRRFYQNQCDVPYRRKMETWADRWLIRWLVPERELRAAIRAGRGESRKPAGFFKVSETIFLSAQGYLTRNLSKKGVRHHAVSKLRPAHRKRRQGLYEL
jgi:hypothetical protein